MVVIKEEPQEKVKIKETNEVFQETQSEHEEEIIEQVIADSAEVERLVVEYINEFRVVQGDMELKTKIASINERMNNLGTMQQNKDRFISAIRRFMEMQQLTAPLLRELIDEITVYETEGVGKNRSQRIMIHYKFIGYIEIPECGSNYKADTRKGVAVEYITKSA